MKEIIIMGGNRHGKLNALREARMKAYSYLIKSDNPKLNGTRKRAIADNPKSATRAITGRVRELFPHDKLRFVDLIIMDIERVTRDTDSSFLFANERHEGYVVVACGKIQKPIYLHYETAVSHSAGGIVVPYKIAKLKYG